MRVGPLWLMFFFSLCAATDAPTLSCSPDSPVAETDTNVIVRAFASAGAAHYNWTVTAGSIAAKGSEARWNLSQVPPGTYRATVNIDDGAASTCSIRVIVTEKLRSGGPPGPQIESGSAFLMPGQVEAVGYGLYSYLLLGAPPIDSTRERYKQVVAAYLGLMPALQELKANIRAKELNATYLLLTTTPARDVTPDWVLLHYDYARARSVLRLLPGQLRIGPYFVSSTNPLLGASEIAPPYLLQDMSAVPTVSKDLPTWWVREFMNQAAQQRFWDTRNAALFTLKLRTTLTVLGAGLPDVQNSLKNWVSWIP